MHFAEGTNLRCREDKKPSDSDERWAMGERNGSWEKRGREIDTTGSLRKLRALGPPLFREIDGPEGIQPLRYSIRPYKLSREVVVPVKTGDTIRDVARFF